MVTVKCNEIKNPMWKNFGDLPLGTMFLDTEDFELLIRTGDYHAIRLEDGEVFRFNRDSQVQLCDVDISYTLKYEK